MSRCTTPLVAYPRRAAFSRAGWSFAVRAADFTSSVSMAASLRSASASASETPHADPGSPRGVGQDGAVSTDSRGPPGAGGPGGVRSLPTGEPPETTIVPVAAPEGEGEGSAGPEAPSDRGGRRAADPRPRPPPGRRGPARDRPGRARRRPHPLDPRRGHPRSGRAGPHRRGQRPAPPAPHPADPAGRPGHRRAARSRWAPTSSSGAAPCSSCSRSAPRCWARCSCSCSPG